MMVFLICLLNYKAIHVEACERHMIRLRGKRKGLADWQTKFLVDTDGQSICGRLKFGEERTRLPLPFVLVMMRYTDIYITIM